MAPRFAARLAEEAARAQAAQSTLPPSELPDLPPGADAAVPAPAAQPAVMPAQARAPEPAPAVPESEPRPAPATRPSPLIPAAPPPEADRPFADAAPAARAPRALLGEPQTIVPDIGGSTLPARAVDDSRQADDDEDEDARAGPPTLASMLPEDAGEWPPRRKKPRPALSPAAAAAAAADEHRFLREARSGARWRRPRVRAALAAALALLVVAGAAQLAWPQRDALAARWPSTLPAWSWLCAQAGCRIEPPRALASLALDGSSLTRTETEHVLLFSADLHNRSGQPVRMPSFDLTFIDLNGAVVARKVLSPEQIGIRQEALAPDAEVHVHARLQVGTLDASGFNADLFYP
jgi:hypothetical protein